METDIIERLMNKITLETSLRVYLQLGDKNPDNWKDGYYYGDVEEEVEDLLNIVERWLERGSNIRESKKL